MIAKVIFDMPFISRAMPQSIATTQKDIIGKPSIITIPVRNIIIAAKPLQPIKLNTLRILVIKATDEILSKRKKVPVRATNHRRLILGTNKSNIPIVNIYAPKKTDHITLEI